MRDKVFKVSLLFAGVVALFIIAIMFYTLIEWAFPALINDEVLFTIIPAYGSFIAGTFIIAGLAVLFSVVVSLSIASFLVEYYRETCLARWVQHLLSISRNVPTIIWGIGAYYLIPDQGIFTIAAVLAAMIIPYATSWMWMVMNKVSIPIRESAYGLGATSSAVIGKIIIPMAKKGILAVLVLIFVKALGETIIIAVFAGQTITGGLLHSFTTGTISSSEWGLLALGLFLITATANSIAQSVLQNYTK